MKIRLKTQLKTHFVIAFSIFVILKFSLIIAEDPRIINGDLATSNNTRHQVSLRVKTKDFAFCNGHICGGSLIGPRKVLTAAHCVYDAGRKRFRQPRQLIVVMGTLNRFKSKGSVTSDISSIVTLKTFNIKTMRDDIAILFLKNGLTVSHTNIQPIALSNFTLPSGAICEVSGWGKTSTSNKQLPAELSTTNVSIFSKRECSQAYGAAIYPGMICAGDIINGGDACQGDSGGPLVFKGSLVGIVSWGTGCGQKSFPGVYTDVKYYIDWITKTNASKKLSWSLKTTIGMIMSLVFVKYINF